VLVRYELPIVLVVLALFAAILVCATATGKSRRLQDDGGTTCEEDEGGVEAGGDETETGEREGRESIRWAEVGAGSGSYGATGGMGMAGDQSDQGDWGGGSGYGGAMDDDDGIDDTDEALLITC
jgi:hypothetical protein